MLVQRIEYQCNYASESLAFENSRSSLENTLIDVMKYYSIIEEPDEVYSFPIIVATEESSAEE